MRLTRRQFMRSSALVAIGLPFIPTASTPSGLVRNDSYTHSWSGIVEELKPWAEKILRRHRGGVVELGHTAIDGCYKPPYHQRCKHGCVSYVEVAAAIVAYCESEFPEVDL